MRILFLLRNTGFHDRLGIMTLSSILKQHGHSVQLLLTEELDEKEYIAKVIEYAPQILAYSIMTGEHIYHIDLNQMVRSHYDCISVFGGPHPTYEPNMIEKDSVDAICRGEGDIYFLELIERMEKSKYFYDIPNFWFKKPDGHIVRNEIGPLVENLDDLPFPERKLMYEADPALRSSGNKFFMTMRGCPYQCTYCFNHVYNKMTKSKGKMLRVRSVDSIIAEIKEVKEKYFLDQVYIIDDTFMIKPKGWMEEFYEKFPKEVGLPLRCHVRANLIDKDRVGKLLKQIGCKNVGMGVECGNNEIANNILRRNISNKQIIKACEILHKYKIRILTQNLIGLPVDNPLEVDLETLDFNIKLRPDFAWSSILYPYPKTEIGQLAMQKGMYDPSFEKFQVSNKAFSPLNFGDSKLKRKLENLHKLFGIIVQFPSLRQLTRFLISLPFTKFYTWLFFALYGYKYVIKNLTWRGFAETFKYYIFFYFKYVTRLEKRKIFSKPFPKRNH